jgi:simple sugar transport system substrate-binding protein
MNEDARRRVERRRGKVSRAEVLWMAAGMSTGAALGAGFGARPGGELPAALVASGLPKKRYRFVFVNQSMNIPFFAPTIYGIQDACAWTGCTYQWTGSQSWNVWEMVTAMRKAIAARVDGIAVALVDGEVFNLPTEEALSRGIPVVSYYADAPNARLAYVGQNLYQSAYTTAGRWLPMVRKGGHVLLTFDNAFEVNLTRRLDGYIQAIKDAGSPVTYEALDVGGDPDQEHSYIEAYYLHHRDIAGMFGTAGTDTLACGNVSRKYGLAAKGVITAGYGTLPEELALVRSGDLTFTTDQQPYLQGFIPTLQLYLYRLTNGVVSPFNVDTSLAYVTRDNVADYLGAQSRFEGTSDAEPE